MEKASPKLFEIDALRGIAILLVFSLHVMSHSGLINKPRWVHDLLQFGKYGTTLFFVVSAFTLFRSSLYRAETGWVFFSNFLIRRVFRIFPMWWAALLIFYVPHYHLTMREFLANMTLAIAFTRTHMDEYFTAQWSIYIEESFYFFFAVFFPFLKDIRVALFVLCVSYGLSRLPFSYDKSLFEVLRQHWFVFPCGLLAYYFSRVVQERPSYRFPLKVGLLISCVSLAFFSCLEIAALTSTLLLLLALTRSQTRRGVGIPRWLIQTGKYSSGSR